jgi:hypothetical protein
MMSSSFIVGRGRKMCLGFWSWLLRWSIPDRKVSNECSLILLTQDPWQLEGSRRAVIAMRF